MGFTVDLVTGLAERIAAAGIAQWNPAGVYAATLTTPVITQRALPDRPDRAIAITAYNDTDTDDAGLSDVTALVQFRTRGTTDPRSVDDLADAVFDDLHGAWGLTLGTGPAAVHTSLIRRRSAALLGPDKHGRHERTDNYYVIASRPNAYRPD